MRKRAIVGMCMVLLAAMLWGTTGTAQTLVPAGLPAHWVGALRLLVSSLFFWSYVVFGPRGEPLGTQLARVPWPWVALAGASMAVYNLTFFAGVKASSVAIGTAIALGSARRLQISLAGVGLCLVAGLSYAVYTLISKRLVVQTPASLVTLCTFSCAAIIAAPAAFAVSGFPATSVQGWWVVVYLGVAATGIAYLLFTHALSRISGTTAVSMCLVEPLTAFCLAILVIGERPPAAAFAGLALVMLGLALVVRAELRAFATMA